MLIRVQMKALAGLITKERLIRFGVYGLSIAAGLLLWQWVSTSFFSPILFPPPTKVIPAFGHQLASGSLVYAARVSMTRILIGFALGTLFGVCVGFLIARVALVRMVAEPWVNLLRFIPTIALLAPFIVWFGIGESAKIGLIVYTTTFIVMLNTIAGVYGLSHQRLRAARAFGASEAQVFLSVIVPGTLPFIFTGMRLAMGNSFMTVVAAELVAAQSGLGFMINQARLFLDSTTIFVGIIALATLGLMTDVLLVTVQNTLFRRYTMGLRLRQR